MRKLIMYCDRCKKEFERWNHKRNELIGIGEIIYDDGDPYIDNQKDLCESCYTELENWWNLIPFEAQSTNAVIINATNEGRWREEEEYSCGLKSKKIWWDNGVTESEKEK